MNAKINLNTDWWRKPELTVEGQIAFWDDQAPTYETTDMTNDNQCEVVEVLRKCREISLDDIVTLGGAVGCRDPKFILEDLATREPNARPGVFFNDLSPKQVEKAKTTALKPFVERGYEITCSAGEIKTACTEVKTKPRRLLIGVYDVRSFFTPHKESGQPKCGFDEYIGDCEIIGERLLFDWVMENGRHELVSCELLCGIDRAGKYFRESMRRVKNALTREWVELGQPNKARPSALQVIGQTLGRKGFFISHWYTPFGMKGMLTAAFSAEDFEVTSVQVAKGTVFCIDPRRTVPAGVVTMLNNVIGNILPHDQYQTLLAIKKIIA